MTSWEDVLALVQSKLDPTGRNAGFVLDQLRDQYLSKIVNLTGRNVLSYYSGWQSGRTANIDINDTDITGVMNAIEEMDVSLGLDIILHTPGGSATATEGIVKYLHAKFGDDIRVVVPGMAMSAGTILACSANQIMMGKGSFLGPIDPQFMSNDGPIPAYNVIKAFEEARRDLKEGPIRRDYWEIELSKYPPALYYRAKDAVKLSSVLVKDWLKTSMFKDIDEAEAKKKIRTILKKLNANNQSHDRHFGIDDCRNMGLNVIELESNPELQDAILSLHYCYLITFSSTDVSKIIENHLGKKYIYHQLPEQTIRR